MNSRLPDFLLEKYTELKPAIARRLDDFANVKQSDWFYELCYCLCTPQSKAANAAQVEHKLRSLDFFYKPFEPVEILSDRKHYIRFHNQKSKNILKMHSRFQEIETILLSDISPFDKRNYLAENILGIGMKESSHFLRNIGYRNLAILDRHILKHLANCTVIPQQDKIPAKNKYLEIERAFAGFASETGIPMDELDLLFWSHETGEILK